MKGLCVAPSKVGHPHKQCLEYLLLLCLIPDTKQGWLVKMILYCCWRVMFRPGQAVCLNCPCWQRLNLWDQWKIEGEPFSSAKHQSNVVSFPRACCNTLRWAFLTWTNWTQQLLVWFILKTKRWPRPGKTVEHFTTRLGCERVREGLLGSSDSPDVLNASFSVRNCTFKPNLKLCFHQPTIFLVAKNFKRAIYWFTFKLTIGDKQKEIMIGLEMEKDTQIYLYRYH